MHKQTAATACSEGRQRDPKLPHSSPSCQSRSRRSAWLLVCRTRCSSTRMGLEQAKATRRNLEQDARLLAHLLLSALIDAALPAARAPVKTTARAEAEAEAEEMRLRPTLLNELSSLHVINLPIPSRTNTGPRIRGP